MFKKILVALDLLDSNKAVFQQALALAEATGAELMLFHALSGESDGGPTIPVSATWDYYAITSDRTWNLYQEQWKAYQHHGQETLRDFAQQAQRRGIHAEFAQFARAPGKAVCDLAGSWGANVIVMGSHRRTGLKELLLGSVSNYVTHHAPCCVFLVHLSKDASNNEEIDSRKTNSQKMAAGTKVEAPPKVQLRR